jgi:hypothetical protein
MPPIPVKTPQGRPAVTKAPAVNAGYLTKDFNAMAQLGETQAYESFNEMDDRYSQREDYEAFAQEWDKEVEALSGRVVKDTKLMGNTKDRFNRWFRRMRVDYGKRVSGFAIERSKIAGRKAFFANIEEKLKAGSKLDPEVWEYEIEDAIGSALSKKYITDAEADKVRSHIRMRTTYEDLKDLPYNEALKALSDMTMSEPERNAIEARLANLENGRRIQLHKDREEWRDYLGDVFNDGNIPTYDDVDRSPLDELEQLQWSARIKQASDALKKNQPSPLEQYDPAVLLAVQRAVDLEPDTITPKEIYGLVGKGISTKQAKTLVADWRAQQPTDEKPHPVLSRPLVKTALATLSKMETDGVFVGKLQKNMSLEEKQLNAELYFNKVRVLKGWVIEHADEPDFDKKLDEYFKRITRPDKEKWINDRWKEMGKFRRLSLWGDKAEKAFVEKQWQQFWGEVEPGEEPVKARQRKKTGPTLRQLPKGTNLRTREVTGLQIPNTVLTKDQEGQFREWWEQHLKDFERITGEKKNPDPDAPGVDYDYRGAWLAGVKMDEKTGHMTSEFKPEGSREQFVRGLDTKRATLDQIIAVYVRLAIQEMGADADQKAIIERAKEMARKEGWGIE